MKHDGAYTAPFRRYACGNGCCGQGEHLCAQQNNNAKENQERIIRTVTSRTDGKTALFKQKTGYARANLFGVSSILYVYYGRDRLGALE